MRLFLVGILALTAVTAHAHDLFAIAQPAPMQFGPLDIDDTTVRVVAQRHLGGVQYDIVIAFQILPKNTREEHYAGLRPMGAGNKLQAIYAHQGEPFRVPGNPRIVTHRMTVNLVKNGLPLEINGAKFAVVETAGGRLELHPITRGR